MVSFAVCVKVVKVTGFKSKAEPAAVLPYKAESGFPPARE